MPVPLGVRQAFQARVQAIIRDVNDLTEDAVRRALDLAEGTRQRVLAQLADLPPEAFTARHLAALKEGLERSIAELVRRYQTDVAGLLERAHELGIDLAEDPLKAAAAAAPGAAIAAVPGLVPRHLLEVLQGYSADLVTNLGAEARRRINGVISQAALGTVQPFDAMQQIAGALPDRSVFKTVAARAEAIYRTEVNRVFSVAAQARMNQMAERLPRLKKRWIAVLDARVRPTHSAAHGQVVPAEATFSVGGYQAQFPRDPVLPASESVNCRCHSVPLVDDEVLEDLGAGQAGPPTVPPEAPVEPTVPVSGGPDAWMDGQIENVREFPTGSVNRLWEGRIGDRRVLIKPEQYLRDDIIRDLITPGGDLAREQAAYLLARRFGEIIRMPALRIRDVESLGRSLVHEFVEGGARPDFLDLLDAVERAAGEVYADIRSMGLFDAVIGNLDRHMGNLLLKDGRLVAIDHGLAFPFHGVENYGNARMLEALEQIGRLALEEGETALLETLAADREGLIAMLTDSGLTREEADEVLHRIDWMLQEGRLPGKSELLEGV